MARFTMKNIPGKYHNYIEAFFELVIVYFISNLPIITLVIYDIAKTRNATFNLDTVIGIIVKNIGSGEIFIYVATLLAPAVYIMIKYHRARKHFPMFSLFIVLQLVIFLLCMLFFVMSRSNQIMNIGFVNTWSLWMYFIALIYWYASLVYGRRLEEENPYKNKKTGAENILDALN